MRFYGAPFEMRPAVRDDFDTSLRDAVGDRESPETLVGRALHEIGQALRLLDALYGDNSGRSRRGRVSVGDKALEAAGMLAAALLTRDPSFGGSAAVGKAVGEHEAMRSRVEDMGSGSDTRVLPVASDLADSIEAIGEMHMKLAVGKKEEAVSALLDAVAWLIAVADELRD